MGVSLACQPSPPFLICPPSLLLVLSYPCLWPCPSLWISLAPYPSSRNPRPPLVTFSLCPCFLFWRASPSLDLLTCLSPLSDLLISFRSCRRFRVAQFAHVLFPSRIVFPFASAPPPPPPPPFASAPAPPLACAAEALAAFPPPLASLAQAVPPSPVSSCVQAPAVVLTLAASPPPPPPVSFAQAPAARAPLSPAFLSPLV